MGGPKWLALSPGSHPSVGLLRHVDYVTRKPICPCQVPQGTVDTVFAQMFLGGSSTDEWVVQMIRLAGVGFVD
jgi:hypothetical protein